MNFVAISWVFLKLHKFVTLVEDVMFMNSATFLITMSRVIKFVIVKHIPTHMAKQFSKYLKIVMNIYSRSKTVVKTFLIHVKFNNTIYELM